MISNEWFMVRLSDGRAALTDDVEYARWYIKQGLRVLRLNATELSENDLKLDSVEG